MPYFLFFLGVGLAIGLKIMGDNVEGDMRLFCYICAGLFAFAGVGGLIVGLSQRGSNGLLLIIFEPEQENAFSILLRASAVLCILVALGLLAKNYL